MFFFCPLLFLFAPCIILLSSFCNYAHYHQFPASHTVCNFLSSISLPLLLFPYFVNLHPSPALTIAPSFSSSVWPTPKPIRRASSAPTSPATSSRIGWLTSCRMRPRVSAFSQSEALKDLITSMLASLMDTGKKGDTYNILYCKAWKIIRFE